MHEDPSETTTTIFDDVAIVTASGELDFAHSIKLAPELNAALRSSARAIVIDLEAVSLVDSAGIALLLNAFRHLDHTGRQLAIACPMGSPRRAFELTTLDRQLPTRDPATRASCRRRQLTLIRKPVPLIRVTRRVTQSSDKDHAQRPRHPAIAAARSRSEALTQIHQRTIR